MDPEVLIADEPLSALDVSTAAAIAQLFEDLQRELGIAMLFISHDLAAVRRLATRVAVMYAGQIVETGDVALLQAPAHPYTRCLVAAAPTQWSGLNLQLLEEIEAVPLLRHENSACCYRGRCKERMALCATTPTLERMSANGTHAVRCYLGRS
jgi:oligopeptide/dipeptide ABC transporter ATP-binding protein